MVRRKIRANPITKISQTAKPQLLDRQLMAEMACRGCLRQGLPPMRPLQWKMHWSSRNSRLFRTVIFYRQFCRAHDGTIGNFNCDGVALGRALHRRDLFRKANHRLIRRASCNAQCARRPGQYPVMIFIDSIAKTTRTLGAVNPNVVR